MRSPVVAIVIRWIIRRGIARRDRWLSAGVLLRGIDKVVFCLKFYKICKLVLSGISEQNIIKPNIRELNSCYNCFYLLTTIIVIITLEGE